MEFTPISLLMLGLLGSFGHCVGMCSPVTLLLTRPAQRGKSSRAVHGWLPLLHAGRLSTYALLGALVAGVGQALTRTVPQVRYVQGLLALVVAGVLIYMALAAAGRVPPVERAFTVLTRRWGDAVRQWTVLATPRRYHAFLLGGLWGLLPCGLVYTALLIATTTGNPLSAAVGMALFGVGTLPAMLGLGWLSTQGHLPSREVLRYLAAGLIFLFGIQMALRGLAAWGWVAHTRVGGIMLW